MTVTGVVGAVIATAVGAWLIARRDRWARDLYQLPDNALGRAVVATLGALLIAAVVLAVADALIRG